MSCIVLRGRWFNIIVLNVQAKSEDKSDDYHSLCEELGQDFLSLLKYHMKITLKDFNTKMERENIFKPTTGNESLRKDSNDNGVRIVNFNT